MVDEVRVAITADESGLRAELALAQARVRDFEAQLRNLASRMVATGQAAEGPLGAALSSMSADVVGAKAEVAGLQVQLDAMTATATAAAAATAEAGAVMNRAFANKESRHFIALFDELSRGQRGAMFSSLGAMARDAGLGMTALMTGVGAMVALLAGHAILHGAEELGEFAIKAQAAAQATGMTVNQYTRLYAALQLIGQKGDSADYALRELAKNLAEAMASASSKAARALHAIGISQEEIEAHGDNTYGMLFRIADALSHYADTASKAAVMQDLLGRNAERLAPLLDHGAAGLRKETDEAQKLGDTLNSKTVPALAEMEMHFRHAWAAIKGFFYSFTVDVIAPTVNAIGRVTGAIDNAYHHAQPYRRREGGAIGAEVAFFRPLAHPHSTPPARLPSGAPDAVGFTDRMWMPVVPSIAGKAHGNHADAAKRAAEGWSHEMRRIGTTIDNALQRQKEKEVEAAARAAQQKAEIARMDANTEIEIGRVKLGAAERELEAEVRSGKITAAQKIRIMEELAQKQYEIERGTLQGQLATLKPGTVQYQGVANQLQLLAAEHAATMQGLGLQASGQKGQGVDTTLFGGLFGKNFTPQSIASGVFQPIGHGFDEMITGMLRGTQTFQMAWRRMAQDMMLSYIDYTIQMAIAWAEKETAQTIATALGIQTRNGMNAAAQAESLAMELASAVKWIAMEAGKVFAAVTAFLAPELGPAAPAGGAAVAAATIAGAQSLAFAAGGFDVPDDTLAYLHKREMVLPAELADSVRGMAASGGGGGLSANIAVHAMDGASAVRAFTSNSGAIATALRKHVRSFGHL